MAGNNRPPYRLPCAGWQRAWLGEKFQHAVAADKVVAVYENTIAPVIRNAELGWLQTGGGGCIELGSGDIPNPKGPFPPLRKLAADYDANDFEDLSVCRKVGHKTYQARRSWHGMFGFTTSEEACENPQQTKYLRARYEYYHSVVELGTTYEEYWIIWETEVDPLTGIITLIDYDASEISTSSLDGLVESSYSCGVWTGDVFDHIEDFEESYPGGTVTHSETETELQFEAQQPHGTFPYNIRHALTITLTEENPLSDIYDDAKELLTEWSPADDREYPWREDEWLTVGPQVVRDELRYYAAATGWTFVAVSPLTSPPSWNSDDYSVPINPFDEYGSGPDVDPLTADWRTAGGFWRKITDIDPNALKWTYSATPPGSWPGTTDEWIDALESVKALYVAATKSYDAFTGSIIGAPSGVVGAKNFDYEHETWRGLSTCSGGGEEIYGGLTVYLYTIGAWSGQLNSADETDLNIPKQATRWTNNKLACELYPGAFIRVSAEEVFLQAGFFTHVPWPSQNFARPCGADRYRPNESTAACVLEDDGSVITLSGASAIASGTLCFVKTGGGNNGIFPLTTGDNIHYTRGTLAAALPSGLIYDDWPIADNFIAAVRFPTAPGICGRVAVTNAVQDGGNIHITIASAVHLRATDDVDFTGISGLGAAVEVASVESPTSFTVAGTLGGAFTSGYVESTGAADWKWHDDQRKGDYVRHEWIYDDEGALAESICETNCLPFSACAPSVMGYWPVAATGYTVFDLPESVEWDGETSVVWQGGFSLGMRDRLAQVPHSPGGGIDDECDPLITKSDDGGGCNADVPTQVGEDISWAAYYPTPPRVEARCELPEIDEETAPALPAGISFPTVAPPGQNGGVEQDTNGAPVIPAPAATDHGIYLRMKDCICDEERFETEYESNTGDCNC